MELGGQTEVAGRNGPGGAKADATCLAIASGQFGVIARFQALPFLSAKAIQSRVRSGYWREVAPKTYVIEGSPANHHQEIMTAALWIMAGRDTRPHSCVSHTTAATLHRLRRFAHPIHLISPKGMASYSSAVCPHRMYLDPADIMKVGPVPVTTVSRTLLDVGAVIPIEELESILEEALRTRSVSIPRLRWQLDRCGGKGTRGSASLGRLLADREYGYIPSESELELRMMRALKRADLPVPSKQKVVKKGGRSIARVDFNYPNHRLSIEVHGWKYHSARARWQHDLRRGNDLILNGERVLVFTWSDVVDRTSEVVRTVRRALEITDPQVSFPLA